MLPLDYPQLEMFYNAFQAPLNKRFANGFNFLAAYTFAKNLGNADGNVGGFIETRIAPSLSTGRWLRTCGHRFTISYLYELPIGQGRQFMGAMSGLADAFLGGWQVAESLRCRVVRRLRE